MNLKNKWKKPDTKGHILYDSIHMKCPEEANPQGQKAAEWLPGARGREELGLTADGVHASFWGDGVFRKLNSGAGCTT